MVIPKSYEILWHLSNLNFIHKDITDNRFTQDVLNHIVPIGASCSRCTCSHKDYDQFNYHDDFLFQNNLLYVLNVPSCFRVSQHYRDKPKVGHSGAQKTLEIVLKEIDGLNFVNLLRIMFIVMWEELSPSTIWVVTTNIDSQQSMEVKLF